MPEPFRGLAQGQAPQSPGPQPAGNGGQGNSAAASLGSVARVMGLIANKNIPPKMKVELWNSSVSPALGEILGGAVIPSFSEWPEELDDYAKRANSILKEKSLSSEEKVAALKSLLAMAEEDINLAPGLQGMKESKEIEDGFDIHQIMEMMLSGQDGSDPGDEDVANFHAIRSRNPQAVVNAAKIIDAGRNRQQAAAEPWEEV